MSSQAVNPNPFPKPPPTTFDVGFSRKVINDDSHISVSDESDQRKIFKARDEQIKMLRHPCVTNLIKQNFS